MEFNRPAFFAFYKISTTIGNWIEFLTGLSEMSKALIRCMKTKKSVCMVSTNVKMGAFTSAINVQNVKSIRCDRRQK